MRDVRGTQVVDSQTQQTIDPIEEEKELVLISPEVGEFRKEMSRFWVHRIPHIKVLCDQLCVYVIFERESHLSCFPCRIILMPLDSLSHSGWLRIAWCEVMSTLSAVQLPLGNNAGFV